MDKKFPTDRPKVSIVIIALNEEKALPILLDSIRVQTYDHKRIEIILVDSMSTDTTRVIMNDFAENNDFYKVICKENINVIQASGWNVALACLSGEVVIRLDAHAYLPCDFIEKNIKCIDNGHEICGGKVKNRITNMSVWESIVNLAENSMFGGSIAAFRHKDTAGFVPTLAFASYKREVFEKVGRFDERLVRTEDNEMHFRMRQAGYQFFYNPDIISFRETRSSFRKLLKQKYLNGYWIGLTLSVCYKCFSVYHFIPLVFVVMLIFSVLLMYLGIWQMAVLLGGIYIVVTIIMSILAVFLEHCYHIYSLLLPIFFFLLHAGYGLGTLIGIINIPRWKRLLKKESSIRIMRK